MTNTIVKSGIKEHVAIKCVFSDKCCPNPYKESLHCALPAFIAEGLKNPLLFVCLSTRYECVRGLCRGRVTPLSSSHRNFGLTMAVNPHGS